MTEIRSESKGQFARVVDTRLTALDSKQIQYVLPDGAATTAYVPLTSTSYSNQGVNWNLNNISTYTARDSRLAVTCQVTCTFSMTNSTGAPINWIQSDTFGFRQYPFNRSVSSVNHSINNMSSPLSTSEILDGIARLNYLPKDANFYNNTQPDLIDSYAAATGTLLNPLASYGSTISGDGVFKPRSLGWTYSVNGAAGAPAIAANSTATIVVVGTIYEPLITSFSNISADEAQAYYAITSERITLSLVPDLFSAMFSMVVPAGLALDTPTAAICSISAPPVLNCIYLTPKPELISELPKESVYRYNDYQYFSNSVGAIAAGATTTVQSQVLSFTNMPDRILVYVRPSNNARSVLTADRYATINSLQAVLDNGLPCLAGASTDQLYDISHRNAITMSRSSFKGDLLNQGNAPNGNLFGCGSVLCLSPAYDLSIRQTDSTGTGGRFQFNVQSMSITNKSSQAMTDATLYVIGISAGVVQRNGSEYQRYLLTTPRDAVNMAKEVPPTSQLEYAEAKYSNSFMMGGGVSRYFARAHAMGQRAFKAVASKVAKARVAPKAVGSRLYGQQQGEYYE